MMHIEGDQFFNKMPQALLLYLTFKERVRTKYPEVKIKILETQISILNKHVFAYVWLPIRKIKNRPDVYIVVSFGLPYRVDSSRIVQSTEPYPNRWTHHVIIQDTNEIDSELMNWIKEAYEFAMNK
jgi:hypothetical protein